MVINALCMKSQTLYQFLEVLEGHTTAIDSDSFIGPSVQERSYAWWVSPILHLALL